MATRSRADRQRPFGQPAIAERVARLSPFRGRAFKFYLLLPRQRGRRSVFTARDARDLFDLLTRDFGGCTRNNVRKSPVVGAWEMREAGRYEVVVDVHSEFFVYTPPARHCRQYFASLERNLRAHLWDKRGLREEQIMVELSEVEIIAGAA